MKALRLFTNLFPFWLLLSSFISLLYPPAFTWFTGRLITFGLGMIMLGMGLTLTLNDFKRVIQFPSWIGVGVFFQFLIMPSLGWALGILFGLPDALAVGLVLVSCCPGGTASNVISFLAKAHVAQSVSMTAISTCLAVVMTPFLTAFLAGSRVHVNPWGLLLSTVQVVILPVALGVFLNRVFHRRVEKIQPFAPPVAVIFIVLIVASIVGAGKANILESGPALLLSVFLLHLLGFVLGYGGARIILKKEIPARTVAIEVGMQNSGLGVVLARVHFANPLTAIPSAISSVFHSVLGSLFAAVWRRSASSHWKDLEREG